MLDGTALYGESHRIVPSDQAGVRKDESPRFDPLKPGAVNAGTDTFTLPYELRDGDSGDPVVTGQKVVYSSGGGAPIGGLVDGQTYYAIVTSPRVIRLAKTECEATGDPAGTDDCDGIAQTPVNITAVPADAGRSHSIVLSGSQPAGDASAMGPRTIAALATPFRGVSVTATNSDDIAAIGVAAGFAGTAAVNISGAVEVVQVNTSSHGHEARSHAARPATAVATRIGPGGHVGPQPYHEIEI